MSPTLVTLIPVDFTLVIFQCNDRLHIFLKDQQFHVWVHFCMNAILPQRLINLSISSYISFGQNELVLQYSLYCNSFPLATSYAWKLPCPELKNISILSKFFFKTHLSRLFFFLFWLNPIALWQTSQSSQHLSWTCQGWGKAWGTKFPGHPENPWILCDLFLYDVWVGSEWSDWSLEGPVSLEV